MCIGVCVHAVMCLIRGLVVLTGWMPAERTTMAEPERETLGLRPSAAQRLGAPDTLGISTLDPGQRPPAMPPGRHVAVRVRMLDDTEEIFDISVSSDGGRRCSQLSSPHYPVSSPWSPSEHQIGRAHV